jgi:hypothetical protein
MNAAVFEYVHWSCPFAIVCAFADVYGCPARVDSLVVLSSEHVSNVPLDEPLEVPDGPDAAFVELGDPGLVEPGLVEPGLVDPAPVEVELFDEEPPHAARPSIRRHTATASSRGRRSDLKCISSVRFRRRLSCCQLTRLSTLPIARRSQDERHDARGPSADAGQT